MKIKKIISIIVILIVAVPLIMAGRILLNQRNSAEPSVDTIDQSKLTPGKVLGESETAALYQSDNFHAAQISVGGEGTVVFAQGDEQNTNVINDLKSQIFTDKNKKDKKLLVTWSTSKTSRCILSYAQAGVQNEKKFEESSFGYDHAVLVGPLASATTFNYNVTAKDKWGNEKPSDRFAVYTGAPEVSFLDLLSGAFKDTFGWAMKK